MRILFPKNIIICNTKYAFFTKKFRRILISVAFQGLKIFLSKFLYSLVYDFLYRRENIITSWCESVSSRSLILYVNCEFTPLFAYTIICSYYTPQEMKTVYTIFVHFSMPKFFIRKKTVGLFFRSKTVATTVSCRRVNFSKIVTETTCATFSKSHRS